jgi:hypothetical protein
MLAIYFRNTKKEKFKLATIAADAKTAEKYCDDIIKSYKQIGYDEVETTITFIGSVFDIPDKIEQGQDNKKIWN